MMPRALCHIKFGAAAKLPPLLNEFRHFENSPLRIHAVVPEHNNDPDYLRTRFPRVDFHVVPGSIRKRTASPHPAVKAFRYAEFVFRAARIAQGIGADIYIAHDITAMIPAFRTARKTGGRLLFRAHELYSEGGKELSPLLHLWNIVERRYVRKADAIVVPEPHRAAIYREEYGAATMPFVVRNIPPITQNYTRTNVLREMLGLGADQRIILYQGLLTPSRCIGELVSSMRSLPHEYRLVLIGDIGEAFRAELERKAADSGVSERMYFIPFVPPEQLPGITASADVGCLLYRNDSRNNYYAAPNKLYEYLFAGLPVVVSDFPALTEIVRGQGAGAWADPEQPESIAQAVIAAAGVKGGTVFASRMRSAFRFEDEMRILESVYEDLLHQPGEA